MKRLLRISDTRGSCFSQSSRRRCKFLGNAMQQTARICGTCSLYMHLHIWWRVRYSWIRDSSRLIREKISQLADRDAGYLSEVAREIEFFHCDLQLGRMWRFIALISLKTGNSITTRNKLFTRASRVRDAFFSRQFLATSYPAAAGYCNYFRRVASHRRAYLSRFFIATAVYFSRYFRESAMLVKHISYMFQ